MDVPPAYKEIGEFDVDEIRYDDNDDDDDDDSRSHSSSIDTENRGGEA